MWIDTLSYFAKWKCIAIWKISMRPNFLKTPPHQSVWATNSLNYCVGVLSEGWITIIILSLESAISFLFIYVGSMPSTTQGYFKSLWVFQAIVIFASTCVFLVQAANATHEKQKSVKKCNGSIFGFSCIALVSHVRLTAHKNHILEVGSKEPSVQGFISTVNSFAILAMFLETV